MSDQSDLHDDLPYFDKNEFEEKLEFNWEIDMPISWEKLIDWATD